MTSEKNPSNKNFYITTTLPYVNSDPHIGFAMEIVRADIVARYKKICGYDVFFNTGTDEHGMKIYQNAVERGIEPQKYVDEYAEKFRGLVKLLGLIPEINFIRTTDENHVKAAQEFWKLCDSNGHIYKKLYKIKYCVGCELEKTESELVEGKCPLHPTKELELIEEENYFFKFSAFQQKLLKMYEGNSSFVLPESRFNEIKAFVKRGLEDFSISRLKSKMPWGVEVPNDPSHVMYVWFDALVNYISAIGWPDDKEKINKWWNETGGVVQYCGKDNLRQQSAMWQAMLMGAGLSNSKQIIIDGFITSGGQKMSKSLGNVINPYDIVAEYGTDALRYYIARELHPFEDSDFTMEKFKESYNANLANGLGNLTSRILKMATANGVTCDTEKIKEIDTGINSGYYDKYEINKVCDEIWKAISIADKYIQENVPFKVVKTDEVKGKEMIGHLLDNLYVISKNLEPIMPETAFKIQDCIKNNKMPEKPLFERKL